MGNPSNRGDARLGPAFACLCALALTGCQTDTVPLSPPMHTRIVDGVTGKSLGQVRVVLLSRDPPASEMSYSDARGVVDLPALTGPKNMTFFTEAPPNPVHAVFDRPGYERYTIDSVTGYGFFKGYRVVRLYPDIEPP